VPTKIQYIALKAGSTSTFRILLHLFFWLTVGYFYYLMFRWNSDFPKVSLIFSAGLLPVAIIETYLVNYLLIPKYLNNKRYGYFFYLSFLTLLTSTWLSFLIVFYALIHILNTEALLEPSAMHPELQVISLNFIVFFAIAVKQVKQAFYMQQEKNKLEKAQLTTQLKLKEAELKLLKAQVHPHFLFNTLNNLYGLTLEKSDQAPQLVLQLSEILDYILYRCDARLVLLSEEIKILENYIGIERIRYPDKLNLQAQFQKDTGKLRITPLILLPFVENAFKHGVSHFPGTAFVQINAKVTNNKLHFSIQNSRSPLIASEASYSKGIGLMNVRKRLELLYPDKHHLEITEPEDIYSVNLTIQLEE
jgi:sensor histidine kinase YesM